MSSSTRSHDHDLKKNEVFQCCLDRFHEIQSQIDVKQRIGESAIFMMNDWLIEVTLKFNMRLSTYFTAVRFLDYQYQMQTFERETFQWYGVSALWMASKCNELKAPSCEEFRTVSCSNANQMLFDAERLMLKNMIHQPEVCLSWHRDYSFYLNLEAFAETMIYQKETKWKRLGRFVLYWSAVTSLMHHLFSCYSRKALFVSFCLLSRKVRFIAPPPRENFGIRQFYSKVGAGYSVK